ncbi:hypothetical protein ANO14919_031270 [Xylariales sp. No.14919]|nr:hypothetical protein ANO14919_031270 [Xylariales sp. No.14919]
MPPPAVKTTLVVGIDFGTTFSGVSWLTCKTGSSPSQPEVISLWETSADNRKDNSDSKKVPSKMYYAQSGEIFWGFKIPAGAEAIEWFKLLLSSNEDLQGHLHGSSHLQDAKRLLRKLNKTTIQLVSEYLKILWDYSLEQIRNAKGESLIDNMPFHVVLSVPAIWTDYARGRMLEAATLAGISADRGQHVGRTTFSFISEPEAAAIATMPDLEGREDLQVGDSFVVVDAGGGTVDVISYKINTLEPLSVSECVEGEGALCGGTYLDKEFESFLKMSIGEFSWAKMNKSDIRKMMNNEWEHGIKAAFKGELDSYTVDLPSRAQREPLQFFSGDIQPVFDKIVSQIGVLVKKQISAIKTRTSGFPKFVILVGGFGRSPYILKHLRDILDDRVSVLQARGDKPWTAICRGAALSGAAELGSTNSGCPLRVQSRIARSNYGWVYSTQFVEGVHDPRDKYWDEILKEWRANGQMQWVIKRGEDISLKDSKTYEFTQHFELSGRGYQHLVLAILTCNDPNPPSRKQGSVRDVAAIDYQTTVPVENMQRKRNRNNEYYRSWAYGRKVVVSGASFDIFLITGGKEKKLDKILVNVN